MVQERLYFCKFQKDLSCVGQFDHPLIHILYENSRILYIFYVSIFLKIIIIIMLCIEINFSQQKFEVAVRKVFIKGPVELSKGMNLTISERLGCGMFTTTFKGNFNHYCLIT